MIADRINRIELSPTLKITAKAKAMKAEGIEVIDFSVGEPDFPTPENIKEAAYEAIRENFTKYTQNDGIPALKQAILEKLERDNGLVYGPEEILVSCGGKHSLYNLCVALINKDEEVIIPAPYWVSYPAMVTLAKGKPVIVKTREENGFRITPEELRANINFNTKAIMLNNPSNPTGTGYSKEELEDIAAIAEEEGIYIIADEIYEKIVYDDFKFISVASLGGKIRERVIVINGVSKAYSMTGWRIGFAAGPRDIIAAMGKVQSHSTSNACSIAQKASVEAFKGPQYEIAKMVAEFRKRRNYLLQKLSQIPGLSCYQPQGAFYLFPNVSSYFNKEHGGMAIRNAYGLSYYLLREAKVAVVPGDAFGMEGYIRLSYAASMEEIEEGIGRIAAAMAKLKESPRIKKVKLDNFFTNVMKRVKSDCEITTEIRDALVQEAESHLPHDRYYEWNANINGVVVQLRTNDAHLYEMWVESWYPAQIESDLEPHGIIYAVMDVPGRDPYAYYHSETKTAVIFNTNYFKQLKSWALGMVADVSERLFDVHSIRGACLEYQGDGTVIIAPKGTGLSTHFWRLMEIEDVLFHSDDWLFVRYRKDEAIADNCERKLYLATDIVKRYPRFAPLFDRSRCENVVMKKKYCEDVRCQQGDCVLDHGEPYCYWGSKESRAVLDPSWIGGPEKYVKRTTLSRVIILQRDEVASPLRKLNPGEAIQILQEGRFQVYTADGSSVASSRTIPFYNPYLLVLSPDRIELQKRYFNQLFKIAPCYAVNIGAGAIEEVQGRLRGLVFGKS